MHKTNEPTTNKRKEEQDFGLCTSIISNQPLYPGDLDAELQDHPHCIEPVSCSTSTLSSTTNITITTTITTSRVASSLHIENKHNGSLAAEPPPLSSSFKAGMKRSIPRQPIYKRPLKKKKIKTREEGQGQGWEPKGRKASTKGKVREQKDDHDKKNGVERGTVQVPSNESHLFAS